MTYHSAQCHHHQPEYYAVQVGRNPGIYLNWDECHAQVYRYPGCVFKKFDTLPEAQEFVERGDSHGQGNSQGTMGETVYEGWGHYSSYSSYQ
ncbi:RNase H1/viroplasmin domain-containing protein [Sporobolomyces salmoneus]|uniref:RNase H1/viroplasmin domain-containing protein n=1 Tax=Sporobolomyces salmoneus TaxID=183962 RepID=UPI00316E19E8